MVRLGEVVGGKFEILALLGKGGMSRVWLARDRRLNKLWAVKEIAHAAGGEGATAEAALLAEASLMRRFDHPALPRIVDIVQGADSTLVVMDYVDGVPLGRVLAEAGHPLDEQDVIDWGIQLCRALEYLHGLEPPIVYCDMKPANAMLTAEGAVKLVDFGAARVLDACAAAGPSIGTRGYAAPEQLDGSGAVDGRTDVYALGATLYALATGRSPAKGGLRPLREVDPGLGEGLALVIARATRPDPRERYATCAEMRRDLENHEKLTSGYRAALRARVARFRAWRGAACALALASVLLLTGAARAREATYEARIDAARAAGAVAHGDDTAPAEDLYLQAIAADPSRVEPYSELVGNVYKADQELSAAEAARLEALMETRDPALERTDGYARLCYDIGTLYLVYFERGDAAFEASAQARGALWFERAAEAFDERAAAGLPCDLTEKERACAEAYAVMGRFSASIAQATIEGEEAGVYQGYWEALDSALAGVGGEGPVMVRLRLCSTIAQAVSSPTYLSGFRRAGVSAGDARGLWDKAKACLASMGDEVRSSERAQELLDETFSARSLEAAERNLELVYGETKGGDGPWTR